MDRIDYAGSVHDEQEIEAARHRDGDADDVPRAGTVAARARGRSPAAACPDARTV